MKKYPFLIPIMLGEMIRIEARGQPYLGMGGWEGS
jgi:hypothetical protein